MALAETVAAAFKAVALAVAATGAVTVGAAPLDTVTRAVAPTVARADWVASLVADARAVAPTGARAVLLVPVTTTADSRRSRSPDSKRSRSPDSRRSTPPVLVAVARAVTPTVARTVHVRAVDSDALAVAPTDARADVETAGGTADSGDQRRRGASDVGR